MIFSPIWQIRTLEMLKSRFRSLPAAFNVNLVSHTSDDKAHGYHQHFSLYKTYKYLDRSYSDLQHRRVYSPADENSESQDGKVWV